MGAPQRRWVPGGLLCTVPRPRPSRDVTFTCSHVVSCEASMLCLVRGGGSRLDIGSLDPTPKLLRTPKSLEFTTAVAHASRRPAWRRRRQPPR